MIGICESEDALGRVQDRHRDSLKGLSRERADLYASIGEAFAQRRLVLTPIRPTASKTREKQTPAGKQVIKAKGLDHA